MVASVWVLMLVVALEIIDLTECHAHDQFRAFGTFSYLWKTKRNTLTSSIVSFTSVTNIQIPIKMSQPFILSMLFQFERIDLFSRLNNTFFLNQIFSCQNISTSSSHTNTQYNYRQEHPMLLPRTTNTFNVMLECWMVTVRFGVTSVPH